MTLFNRLLALLLGLALAGAGVVIVVELIVAQLSRPAWLIPRPDWHQGMQALSWTSPGLVLACILCIVIGVLLIGLQLTPRIPEALPLQEDHSGRSASIDRRGLQERLRRVAERDRDVMNARVRARKRKARVDVAAPPDADISQLRTRLDDALKGELSAIAIAGPFRHQLRVHESAERAR